MDTVVEFLTQELKRVQSERDAAQANERTQMMVMAELRQQVGLLMATVELAHCAANEGEHLLTDGLADVLTKTQESEFRIRALYQTRAVT